MRPILLGIGASFFFACTFILNRVMELGGGSWIWSASLRYLFMIPFLFVLVMKKRNLASLLREMKKHPGAWFLWSFVGFGLFYAPLCFSAAYGPGWLLAGTWQVTIISGSLIVPLFYETYQTPQGIVKRKGKIPWKGMGMSIIILLGIALMQFQHANQISSRDVWLGVLPVLLASFAYPLGNRKMMELCEGRLDSFQRVLGMTLASLPLWVLLSIYGIKTVGLPSKEQTIQTVLVAISSGVIATVMFFRATDLARGNMQKLAAVEATQSMEVLFAAAGELCLLNSPIPSILSWSGMLIVMIGMVLHSYVSHVKKKDLNALVDETSSTSVIAE